MSLLSQTRSNRTVKSGFEQDFAVRVAESRRFPGLLDVHSEINQISEHLDVSLRLVVATHDPE